MKLIPLSLPLILFAGCRTAAPQLLPMPAPVSVPTVAVAPPAPASSVTAASQAAFDQRLKQQRQMIEALMSQNDALTTKLNAPAPIPPPAPEPAPISEVVKVPPLPTTETPRPLPTPSLAIVASEPAPHAAVLIAPNADGMIDLTVAASGVTDPVNPFAVRHLPAEAAREITLRISGVVDGTAPAVLVNGRAVQIGESVESLTLERCESDAAIFRRGEHLLRLPIGVQPVRIRVAL